MKKIRLFAIMAFILSVNIPLAYSLVEPIGSTEEAISKLLAQKERNSSLIFKIALRNRRLGRRSSRGKRLRGNSLSAKIEAIRSKFSQRILNGRRRNTSSARGRAIRRKLPRRIHRLK